MATVTTAKTAKEGVLEMVGRMQEDATLAEILDAVRVRYEIDQARRELDAGLGIPHEEVKKQLAKWLI